MLNRTTPVMIAIAALVLAPMPAPGQQTQSSEARQDRQARRHEQMTQRMTERMAGMAQRMAEMQKRGPGANGYPGQMGDKAGQRGACQNGQGMNGQSMQQGLHKGMGRNAEGRGPGVQQRAGPPQLEPDSPAADE